MVNSTASRNQSTASLIQYASGFFKTVYSTGGKFWRLRNPCKASYNSFKPLPSPLLLYFPAVNDSCIRFKRLLTCSSFLSSRQWIRISLTGVPELACFCGLSSFKFKIWKESLFRTDSLSSSLYAAWTIGEISSRVISRITATTLRLPWTDGLRNAMISSAYCCKKPIRSR